LRFYSIFRQDELKHEKPFLISKILLGSVENFPFLYFNTILEEKDIMQQ